MSRARVLVASGLMVTAVFAATVGSSASPKLRWKATDLGPHWPVAINSSGQVVLATMSDVDLVFVWRAGRLTDLGPGTPAAINDRGQIVGEKRLPGGATHAFLWENGRAIDLGTLPGARNSGATALNERGQVVGWSGPSSKSGHAFLWQRGRMTDLGVLPGGKWSTATDVNERGQVVGSSDSRVKQAYSTNNTHWRPGHAFIWERGRMTDLGTVGRKDKNSAAVGINNAGVVVASSWHTVPSPEGEKYDADFPHGFLWKQGTKTPIGPISGYPYSEATALNDHGQVAGCAIERGGYYYDQTSGYLPFRWQGGRLTTLGHLDSDDTFGCAADMNEGGLVVGESGWRAFAWHAGKLVALPGFKGDFYAKASAVNDRGWIIGTSGSSWYSDDLHGVLWKPNAPVALG